MFLSLSLSFPIWKVEADESPFPRAWHLVCYQSMEIFLRNPSSILTLARSSGRNIRTNCEPGGSWRWAWKTAVHVSSFIMDCDLSWPQRMSSAGSGQGDITQFDLELHSLWFLVSP